MPSTIYWPQDLPPGEALPLSLRDGYGSQQRDPNLRTQFPLGDRARQLYADMPEDVSVSFLMSGNQLQYFRGFWWYDLAAGNRWFWMPIWANGTLELREVKFNSPPPRFELVGARYDRFAMSVITRRGTQMSPDEWEIVKQNGGVLDTAELLQALSDFANNEDY